MKKTSILIILLLVTTLILFSGCNKPESANIETKNTNNINTVLKYFYAIETGGDLNSIEFSEPIIHVLHNFSERKVSKEELKEANEIQLKIMPDLQNRIL